MKKLIVSALFTVTAISATAQKKAGNPHLSLKLEAQETIHKGNKFLLFPL